MGSNLKLLHIAIHASFMIIHKKVMIEDTSTYILNSSKEQNKNYIVYIMSY